MNEEPRTRRQKALVITLFSALILIAATISTMSFLAAQQRAHVQDILTQPPTTSTPVAAPDPIKVSEDIFAGEERFVSATYTNESNGMVVEFKNVPSEQRTFIADVYVDGTNIGEVRGQGREVLGFSPSDTHFVYRTRQRMGGGDHEFRVMVFDLQNSMIQRLGYPRGLEEYNGLSVEPKNSLTQVVRPYTWEEGIAGDAIALEFYFIAYFGDNNYYRLSPRELWRYDLITGEYSFIRELAEDE